MNERIRELAKQAGHRYVPSSNSGPLRIEYLTPEMEKFAELIVQECTDLVRKYMTRWPEDCELTKQIKEHFGVEE